MKLAEVKIYRMTHIENIPHILRFGITNKTSQNSNKNFIAIGDTSLINTRNNKSVTIDNGRKEQGNYHKILLGDFIPFYFGLKMPMLYVIQHGGNFVPQPTQPENIVYLVCSVDQIIQTNQTFYFSDGHATENFTRFYDKSKVRDLPNILDWNAIKKGYWGGDENLTVKHKKQAEFLLLGDLPPDFIIGYACFNDFAKMELQKMGIEEEKIKVFPKGYY